MIYDLVKGAFASLVNRWGDLKQALEQLNKVESVDPVPKLIKDCGDEIDRIEDKDDKILNLRPAIKMFAGAIELFVQSEVVRKQVLAAFEGRFGKLREIQFGENSLSDDQLTGDEIVE